MQNQRAAIRAFEEQILNQTTQDETPMPSDVYSEQAAAPYHVDVGQIDAGRSGGEMLKKPAPPAPAAPARRKSASFLPNLGPKTSEELQLEKEPLKVRETGFLFWKTVIVPPNAYVVHTRRGFKDPTTIGLGLSFRYNPYTDSYLVVPAAMQTIGIIANCIGREKQGINVLAYVQWMISDFTVAYQHLDFSDSKDPMAIVNAQLREQAEAAIKDKVATMSVEEVLTDKAPIIEELTERMKSVAEGRNGHGHAEGKGLGLKIVTVQIKEALVSSQKLWEHLQAPFRNEREREARLSRLAVEEEIRSIERDHRLKNAKSEAETETQIKKNQAEKESEAFDIVIREKNRRLQREQEEERRKISMMEETELTRRVSLRKLQEDEEVYKEKSVISEIQRTQTLTLEKARVETETQIAQTNLEVDRKIKELSEQEKLLAAELSSDLQDRERKKIVTQKQAELDVAILEIKTEFDQRSLKAQLALKAEETRVNLTLKREANDVQNVQTEREMAFERYRQETENSLSQSALSHRMMEVLPQIAREMPKIDELRTIQLIDANRDTGQFDSMRSLIFQVFSLIQGWKLGEEKSTPINTPEKQ